MNTLTELTILIFTIVLLPILVPLIFLIFVPETIGRKELVRTGRLFVVKTILAWLYQFVPKLAETRFSLDLS